MKNTATDPPFKDIKNIIKREEGVLESFPYPIQISFLPFYEHLRRISQQKDRVDNNFTQSLTKELEARPVLLKKPSLKDIEDHKELFPLLMTGFFPPFFDQKQYGYISAPFSNIPLYVSEHFKELMEKEDAEIKLNIREEEVFNRMISNACTLILQKFYGQNIEPSFPTIISIRNKTTQLEQHLSLNIITDFVQVKAVKEPPLIDEEQLRELIQNPTSSEKWIACLPPEHFEFKGLLFIYFSDVTEMEIISRLKDKMLGKDPTPFLEDVDFVQKQLKSFFKDTETSMGLKIMDQSFALMIQNLYRISTSALGQDIFKFSPESIEGSSYHKVWETKEPLIIEDLAKLSDPTIIEKRLMEKGLRSLLLYPSVHQDSRRNQIVELYSPNPKTFSYQSLVKLKIILPLIEAGLNKKRDELENNIANIVQDQFTNIDPSVYWKFRESAIAQLKIKEGVNGQHNEIAPVGFKQVYPFYGQADIIGSSVHRNKAIQKDMLENLRLVKSTLKEVAAFAQTHLLDYYSTKADQFLRQIQKSFRPSDETHILEMLKNDLHPCLQNLKEEFPDLIGGFIDQYFDRLNPHLEVIYQARKDFEDSVALINHHLSKVVQEADDEMQKKLPHYFEKYQTDGVEYNMYIGQSILQNQQFSKYHLKNFRLWQLLLMCRVTKKVERLQQQLSIPLQTAQLIFVYSDPLDIRFRMDEKHFDVDGAYNVRYEIIKKRIDKAFIKGTKQRLTQPGKIAIVYLHEKNRIEYLDYFQYLMQKKFIDPNIEELELGKLQGVEGLRAFRVSVV